MERAKTMIYSLSIRYKIIALLAFLMPKSIMSQNSFESYYLWLGHAPDKVTADWCPNNSEMQGLTHDNDNWFFTNTRYYIELDLSKTDYNGHLWKIPLSVAIGQNLLNVAGVEHLSMDNIPELKNESYEHFGDPDYFFYPSGNIGYVVVPLTGGSSGIPAVAFFSTNPLKYVDYAYLDKSIQGGDNAGWCSIDKRTGDLITSNDNTTRFERYQVKWEDIGKAPKNHSFVNWIDFYEISSFLDNVTKLEDMQGGEFSPSGEYFYISCGTGGCAGQGHGRHPSDGIWVFETNTWKALSRSTNSIFGGAGYFNYSFENNCNTCYQFPTVYAGEFVWHPEGLTVWDHPKLEGQLHVVTNRFAGYSRCDDEFSLHHYSKNIFVDKKANGAGQGLLGTPSNKFNSVNAAYNHYPIWDGSEMILTPGVYNDTGLYNKRMIIRSLGGIVLIGQQ